MTTITEPKNLDDILEIVNNSDKSDIFKISNYNINSVNIETNQLNIEGFLINLSNIGYITVSKINPINDNQPTAFHKFSVGYYPTSAENGLRYVYDPNDKCSSINNNKKVHDVYIEIEATYYES